MSKSPSRGHALRRGRVSETGRVYLVTTVTFQRQPLFSDFQCARLVVRCLRHMELAGRAETLCHVLMPDHLHWLLVLGEGRDLSRLVQTMKSFCARGINQIRGTSGQIWQAVFHDHALRQEKDLLQVARYVVANPVRAGLVERLGDYPFWDAKWL